MAKTPNAPTNMSFLSTGRKFYEATRSPTPALITTAGRFPGIVLSDSIPPSRPGTPAGTAVGTSQIDWTWLVSTDTGGSGLQGYRVYLDGATSPITTVTTNTYSSTGHLPSTNHTLRVEAFDGQGNSTQSFLGAQLTGAGSVAISWNPGFYVLAPGIGSHSTTTMDQARTATAKGWEQIVYWKTMETARGVYDWTYTDQLLNDCKTRGLRLILQPWNNAFSGSATTALPAYLATELGGQPGYYASSDGGFAAKLWRVEIMDRFLALLQAIGARYGSDAMFEGIRNGESALPGGNTTESDWNAANYKTQYLRLIATLPTYVPTSNAWVSLNYGFPQVDFPSILAAMLAARCGLCGPDVWTGNTDHSTNGDRACRGLVWDAAANGGLGDWVAGGIDYRGKIPILHDWQGPEMGGKEGSPSLATLYAFAVGTNKSNHACIVAKVGAASPSRAAPDDYYWDNTSSAAVADANKYTQDIKAWMATAGSLVLTKPTAYPSVITGSGTGGQLAAGHFDDPTGTVLQDMYAVYPRPDSETNTYAYHRNAYFDGINAVPYDADLGVEFGAYPYFFEKVSGPSWLQVGGFYGDAMYAHAYGTPDALGTFSVVIRARDQRDAATGGASAILLSWTIVVGPNAFTFLSPSGSDSANGAFGTPVRTLSKLWGATEGATTGFANKIVIARAGTYSAYDQGNGYGMKFYNGRSPMTLMPYPGETVVVDQSTLPSNNISCFQCGGGTGDEMLVKEIQFTGHPSAGDFYSIRIGEAQQRLTFLRNQFPSAWQGGGQNNASCIFYISGGSPTAHKHVFHRGNITTDFGLAKPNGAGNNAWGQTCAFTVDRGLFELNQDLGNDNERCIVYLKDSCANCEIRENIGTMRAASVAILTGTQPAGGGNAGPTYIRHNYLDAGSVSIGTGISLDESQNGQGGSTIKYTRVARNSIRRGNISANGNASASYGPYVVVDNLGETTQSIVQRNYANQTLGNYTTSTGNVALAASSFDTNIKLQGTARTTYLGTKGAEIA